MEWAITVVVFVVMFAGAAYWRMRAKNAKKTMCVFRSGELTRINQMRLKK